MAKWIYLGRALKQLKELESQLKPRQVDRCMVRAMNKSAETGRKELWRGIRGIFNIPQKYADRITIKKATLSDRQVQILADKTPLPLEAFSPQFKTQNRTIQVSKKGKTTVKERGKRVLKPGLGVSVEIYKGSRKSIDFAFMIPKGRPKVFARGHYLPSSPHGFERRYKREKTGSDINIAPLITLSVSGAFNNKENVKHMRQYMQESFVTNLKHELEAQIKKITKK